MPIHAKLFRATVIMGVSLTASGCGDSRCHHCEPPPVDGTVDTKVADAKPVDAGVDAPPSDAPADAVIII